jgi:hypothetical protein
VVAGIEQAGARHNGAADMPSNRSKCVSPRNGSVA